MAPLDIFQGWLSKAGFRQDQARGKGGKWIPEGGTKDRRAAARQKEKQLAARREADRARGRRERAAQRRASGEESPRSAMIIDRGGTSSKQAIAKALSLMPRNHFDLVAKDTKFVAVKDFSDVQSIIAANTTPGTTMMAFFHPLLRAVFVPDAVEGMSLVSGVTYALHEAAHALDFAAGVAHGEQYGLVPGGFYLSERSPLAKIMTEEYNELPPIKEWYAEHYKAEKLNREIFAEIYSATFNPTSPRKSFMGMLSAREVRVLFPRSVDYIKNMRVP